MLLTDVFHFFKSIYLYCYTDEKFKGCHKEDMTLWHMHHNRCQRCTSCLPCSNAALIEI